MCKLVQICSSHFEKLPRNFYNVLFSSFFQGSNFDFLVTMAELVYFDLETTGLIATDPDILQIGAITSDCSDSFDKFIKPEIRETTPEAEVVNNLKYDSKTETLYLKLENDGHQRICKTVSIKTALLEFIIWLRNQNHRSGSKVVLVAYNAIKFDTPILLKKIIEHNLKSEFLDTCSGFIDPFKAVCELYPGYRSKSQENMLKSFKLMAPHEFTSHNAIQDCNDLRRLTAKMTEEYVKKHPKKTANDFYQKYFVSCQELNENMKHSCVIS